MQLQKRFVTQKLRRHWISEVAKGVARSNLDFQHMILIEMWQKIPRFPQQI